MKLKPCAKIIGKYCFENGHIFFWTWGVLLGIYGAVLHDSRPALLGGIIFMLGTGLKLESSANREFWALHALYEQALDLANQAIKEVDRLRKEHK